MGRYHPSIEALEEKVRELELLNQQLLMEKNAEVLLDYPWTGNLGHWYWNINTNTVTFNPMKAMALGYLEAELPEQVGYEFFTEKLHPEDYGKTMDAMRDHLCGKVPVYEVEYRIRTKNGSYKWYYDRGKITSRNMDGSPAFLAGIVFDITKSKAQQIELEEKNKLLEELATLDGLTRINNHRSLLEQLEFQIQIHKEKDKPLSLLLFDIDNFKLVNDTMGHVTGDHVLCELAELIKQSIRTNDFAGRYGGEEFLVVLPGTDIGRASVIGGRIRRKVEKTIFFGGIRLTVSGGVKEYQGEDLSEFIEAVDKRLYQAKEQGKNRLVQ